MNIAYQGEGEGEDEINDFWPISFERRGAVPPPVTPHGGNHQGATAISDRSVSVTCIKSNPTRHQGCSLPEFDVKSEKPEFKVQRVIS